MTFPHRRRVTPVVAVLLTAGVTLGGLAGSAEATTVTRASLNFNAPAAGQTMTTLVVGGAYPTYLSARVVTANGGRAVSAVGNTGYGNAIDFPSYQPANTSPPIAIVALRNRTNAVDPLNGGSGNFSWQADFSLDDNLGTETVDGDNVVQRGLSPQKQWKLSVDEHRVQCFVRTTANGPLAQTPAVRIPLQTSNIRWWRAICNRSATGVLTLRLYAYWNNHHAWLPATGAQSATSAAGNLDMTGIPVAIGGKLNDAGGVQFSPSTDQFNGKIDNVILSR